VYQRASSCRCGCRTQTRYLAPLMRRMALNSVRISWVTWHDLKRQPPNSNGVGTHRTRFVDNAEKVCLATRRASRMSDKDPKESREMSLCQTPNLRRLPSRLYTSHLRHTYVSKTGTSVLMTCLIGSQHRASPSRRTFLLTMPDYACWSARFFQALGEYSHFSPVGLG